MFSFFRKDQGGEPASRPESVPAKAAESASPSPPGTPDEPDDQRGAAAADPAVNPAIQRAGEGGAGSASEALEADAAPDAAPEVTAPPALTGPRRGRPRTQPPGADARWLDDLPAEFRAPTPRPQGRRLAAPGAADRKRTFTPQQRLLLLDSWQRSGLPAGDFAALVGISKHTLYLWKKQFDERGPAGLMEPTRGAPRGGRLPELTRRTILMLKTSHPEWGCQRISDMLARGPGLPACASTVARILHEAGYEVVDEPTHPHPDQVRRFERAKPNELWQTDLFTFVLKRQNRRVYLVAFLDDHSRFITSYGLHASCSTSLVIETLEAGLASFGPPSEILTDNGPQYVTWRGKSQFTKRLEQRGIRQLVARPRRPQTLGKIERFWGTLWREFLETALFADLGEARTRIGLFIDYFNFQRTHSGIDGLVPADRFFGAASDVARTLKERVAAGALDLARHGQPPAPFYVTGQLEGQAFSVHAEGPRLILTRPGETRREVELVAPPPAAAAPRELPRPVCPAAPDSFEPGPETSEDAGAAQAPETGEEGNSPLPARGDA
jgi:transposase InsO family protein